MPFETAAALVSAAAKKGPREALRVFETRLVASHDRRRRGIYYTPAPLARWVVRSAHRLLRGLGIAEGLGAPRVRLVDPAAGTCRFLTEAVGQVEGADARKDLLSRSTAMDLDSGALLGGLFDLACRAEGAAPQLLSTDALRREAWEPSGWPRGVPTRPDDVPVFLGNPPWGGYELAIDPWVASLLEPYRQALPPTARRSAKWLRDRYVQYLAVLHWALGHHEVGVLGLVVNHGILDNLVMAGLREAWLRDVSGLWALDLGGSAHKPPRAPVGHEAPPGEAPPGDDNVFEGVAQGAAVLLAVRGGERRGLHHHRLFGTREEKLEWLARHSVDSVPWRPLQPERAPHVWVPGGSWPEGWKPLPELFEEHSIGIITGRDRLVIAPSRAELLERIRRLRRCQDLGEARKLGLQATRTFDAGRALQALQGDGDWRQRIQPILFKPDRQHWIFYAPYLVERPRWAVMRHLSEPANRALVVPRRAEQPPEAVIATTLVGHRAASSYHGSHVFPLYLRDEEGELISNLQGELLEEWSTAAGREVSPEEAFERIHQVLRDPGYCAHHSVALRLGWPRVSPWPSSGS